MSSRLVQETRKAQSSLALGSLATFSSPKQYLEFVLSSKLGSNEIKEIAHLFIRKFSAYTPKSFSLIAIQQKSPEGYDELVSLIAQTANIYETKGD